MAEPENIADGEAGSQASPARPRTRLLQEDVPSTSLEQALRVPRAIAENYAFKPTRPLNVAQAMAMSPTSGPFRMITGAAVAYGLTTGAAQAPEIGLTPIGMRILRPTALGDDVAAMREALLRPKVVGEFLRSYDGAALPPDNIAKNVLEEKGVPADRLDGVLDLIVDSAKSVGFIREWNGKRYIDLTGQALDTGEPAGGLATANGTERRSESGSPQAASYETTPSTAVSVNPAVHINIEIHIAADASSDTVEDIFRSMRRYVLNLDGPTVDESATTG